MTGEHLSDCPAPLHVLSQDKCGVLFPARGTSALYWTARRLKSERTLAGVKGFLEEGSHYINERKFKSQDEIDKIEADLDKLKITIQNVEKEDSEVFEICCNAILLDTDVLRIESQKIENELQSLNKLGIEDIKNTEDVEFAANCKRTLMNGVKNRKAQHTVIEFELMKLVRYQDSRITTMCKDELIYLQEIINREIHIIKEKVKRLERSNKMELLEICKKLSQEFMQLVNSSIHLTESILQSVSEKKRKIELEDAQFVAVCKDVFHSHIVQRKKEISLKLQTIDQIADIKLVPENLDPEIVLIDPQVSSIAIRQPRINPVCLIPKDFIFLLTIHATFTSEKATVIREPSILKSDMCSS
ncbi:uncharacterized protein TNCV_1582671 [Trichonephila clavipes]|nr:uncharacterized protein TNCV_1582671 [Trichonephila clavipes]